MKNTGNLLLAIAFAATMYTACTPPPPPPPPGPVHYMVASSPSVGTFSVTGTSVSAGGAAGAKVSITGEGASGESFTVYINPYAGTAGTLSIGGETGVLCKTASGTWITSISGSITITATSPDIIGTFGYLGSDSNAFTGSFNVSAP